MSELSPIVEQHLNRNLKDIKSISNYTKREFVNNFNGTLLAMAKQIQRAGFIRLQSVKDWLMINFLLSPSSVNRYITIISAHSHIFTYDEPKKMFVFPIHIQEALEQEKRAGQSQSKPETPEQ